MTQENNSQLNIENSTLDLAPIVLFVYNRPDHTKQTVEALQQNELANESELFIYSDAAKNENTIVKVNQIREYIKTINGFKKVTIIEREKNWGLANSIIDGVTKIVNEYGKIIVLEDDLVTSPYFLKFMNEALEFYEDEEKVFSVTGYAYPIKNDELANTFFINDECSWSWATWDRAWQYYSNDAEFFIDSFSKKQIYEFNYDGSYNSWSQILLNKDGKLKTWAIFWYATIFLQDGLTLHPKDSFVINNGFDGSGTNCGVSYMYETSFANKYNVEFNQNITLDKTAKQAFIRYFNSLKIPFWRRVVNKIEKNLKGRK